MYKAIITDVNFSFFFSWAADPVIEAGLKQAPEDGVFILCQVGERDL